MISGTYKTMAFDPDLYCLLHRGVTGDLDFYTRLCANVKQVLELGCGDGRVAQSVVTTGCEVLGIDNHPQMIEKAVTARAGLPLEMGDRLTYQLADLCDLDLGRAFDRVIMPFTTIFCLNADAKRRCMEGVLRHLNPGGRFALDTYSADIFMTDEWSDDDEFSPLTSVVTDVAQVDIYERTTTDRAQRIADVTYGHQVYPISGEPYWVEYTIRHHYCLADELSRLMLDVGFTHVEVYGGFDGHALSEDADRVILVGDAPK
jgi:SAM-dependent methyltransferase